MKQHRYRGVIEIAWFNWHQYVAGTLVCLAASWVLLCLPLPVIPRAFLAWGTGLAGYWLVASLAASHYIYDRSGLTTWEWVKPLFPTPPTRWANIHCGFDETTAPLDRIFPRSERLALDIFDDGEMTEASLLRARRYETGAPEAVRARCDSLPARDEQMDAVFMLFAAHELRHPLARTDLFRELHRVLARGGCLLLVEHLRDGWNFLAFGPGFWHFLPRREWEAQIREAGFTVEREFPKTPFVRAWLLRKEAQ
ncbi:MAG TPA: class I SAM-dependent methyltransferase [Verrucomicrobiae bacterium]|nr:class I SAM-dependent methyltransferase [Verrucomicrobiae bacterium]